MKYRMRLLIGLGLAAAATGCAGRHLPPEPDAYVAADAIGPERAAELAASPAAAWLDDLNSTEMSTLCPRSAWRQPGTADRGGPLPRRPLARSRRFRGVLAA